MTSTSTNKSGNPELQPDDIEIVRLLKEDFLLLTSEQFCQLFPGRPLEEIQKRLDRLVDLGYLSTRSFQGELRT
jgi:hypothetical protein